MKKLIPLFLFLLNTILGCQKYTGETRIAVKDLRNQKEDTIPFETHYIADNSKRGTIEVTRTNYNEQVLTHGTDVAIFGNTVAKKEISIGSKSKYNFTFYIYIKRKDSTMVEQYYQVLNEDYDLVYYKFKNDTIVDLRIVNEKTKNEKQYTFSKFRRQTSMSEGTSGFRFDIAMYPKLGINSSENSLKAGDFKTALSVAKDVLEVTQQDKNEYWESITLNQIGKIYFEQGNYPQAMEYFFRALKIAQKEKEKNNSSASIEGYDNLADFLNNIGMVYHKQGNDSTAMIYYLQSLKINESIGIKNDSDWNYRSLDYIGNMYDVKRDFAKAIAYFTKALNMGERNDCKDCIATSLNNIGHIYIQQGNDSLALINYFQSFSISKESSNKKLIAATLMNIGYVFDIEKKYAESLEYWNNAREVAEEIGNMELLKESFHGLSAVNENIASSSLPIPKEEYWKRAFDYYRLYEGMKSNLYSAENSEKIAKIQIQKDAEEKERKRAALLKAIAGGAGLILIVSFFTVLYYVRKRKTEKIIANEKINTLLKEQELKSVSDMLEVQESERKRIASDLHDRLGSMLSTVKLYFGSVEEQMDKLKEQNKEQYNKANLLLDEAVEEVRKISHNLVSGELVRFGLVSALKQMKKTIEDAGQLKMKVLAFGMENRLDSNIEIALYRTIQELLNNILKHSEATEVTIQLNKTENNLNIMVEDNGVGFDWETAKAKNGMGLKNIETRVNNLKGKISVDSRKGRGTITIIDVPI